MSAHVLHSFPEEDFDAAIPATHSRGSRKVRAGLQVRDRLNRFEEQGRRIYPRPDVYDLWFLPDQLMPIGLGLVQRI
jgi:hypothetical protein